MKKELGMIVIVVLLVIGAIYVNSKSKVDGDTKQNNQVEELPKVNFRAPSLSLTSLDSGTVTLKQARGKLVMINFWATWCGPCNLEAPELANLYNKYNGKLVIYGVNLTNTENSLEDVQAFVNKYGFHFPVLLDKKGTIAKKYRAITIPSTFFINKEGIIVDKIVGYGGKGMLTKKAEKLVKTNE